MNNKLHLITDDGQYRSMVWSWMSQVSYTNARSLVCLIDGTRLCVSDFTHSSIPPPMCSYEIHCPSSILAVASDDEHDQLVLVLADRSIAICGQSSTRTDDRTIVHLSELKSTHHVTSVVCPLDSPINNIHHAAHFRLVNGQFYFIEDNQLHSYDLKTNVKHSLPLNFSCLTTAVGQLDNKSLYLQDEHGKIYRLVNNQLHVHMNFPRACSHFSVLVNEQCLGLTENYRLYLNTTELAHHCNSYFVHDRTILVYSTLQHQLIFRSLVNDQTIVDTCSRRTGIDFRLISNIK
jgi:hypothetical protein